MAAQTELHPWTHVVVNALSTRNLGISSQTIQKIKGLVDPVFRALARVFEATYSLSSLIVTYCKNKICSVSSPSAPARHSVSSPSVPARHSVSSPSAPARHSVSSPSAPARHAVSASEVLAALNQGQAGEEWAELESERRVTDDMYKQVLGMSMLEVEDLFLKGKFRYNNIPCIDSTRVKLPNGAIIHANRVFGGQTIATQGPTAKSTPDFWEMVLQQPGSVRIVMLTYYAEGCQVKCYRYLPIQPVQIGSHTIQPPEEIITDLKGVKIRNFSAVDSSQQQRQIQHYMYWGWPDHGCVPPTDLASFVKKIHEDQRQSPSLIVHCSAGIGRTGVFLAIYELYARFKRGELFTDQLPGLVPNIVRELRNSRYGMVQKPEQYQLIYDTLKILIAECTETN